VHTTVFGISTTQALALSLEEARRGSRSCVSTAIRSLPPPAVGT
jgi:hypothetical protein